MPRHAFIVGGTGQIGRAVTLRLLGEGWRVTVASRGVPSTHPREWWFVKRMLDGRQVIPLNHRGKSLFHTTAAANIAALISAALQAPKTQILNCGDPRAPTTAEIGAAIAAELGWTGEIRPLDIDDATSVGDTPWSTPSPFVLDLSACDAIGYRPATTYKAALPAICAWLKGAHGRDWRALFPILAAYPHDPFNYAAEDRLSATL